MPIQPKLPKYEQVRQALLEDITSGEYPVGSRLPSIQETSRAMNASYVTTQRAYRMLAEDGVLDSRPGLHGSRVIASDKRPGLQQRTVVSSVFRPLHDRNVVDNFALEMCEAVSQFFTSHRIGMFHHRTGADREGPLGAVDMALDDVASGAAQGLVLDQILPDAELRKAEAAACPAVVLFRHPEGIALDSVAPDMERVGREVGRLALEAGYMRLVIAWVREEGRYDSPVARTRSWFFEDYAQGILDSPFPPGAIELLQEHPASETPRIKSSDDALAKIVGMPPSPDGVKTLYAATGDRMALRLSRILRERGFRIPEDAGVTGLLDAEINRLASEPVSTWRVNPTGIGRTAGEMLLNRMDHPARPFVRRYVQPVYVNHGTL